MGKKEQIPPRGRAIFGLCAAPHARREAEEVVFFVFGKKPPAKNSPSGSASPRGPRYHMYVLGKVSSGSAHARRKLAAARCGMNILSGSERHGGPGRRRLSSLCYRAARLGPAEKAQSTLMVEPMRVDPFISSMAPCASFCFSYSTRA